MGNYAGADWMQQTLSAWRDAHPGKYPAALSELGKNVADFLGEWQYGIYHLHNRDLLKVQWDNKTYIEITIHCCGLSTYDFNDLTRLVFIAHEMALRVELEPAAHHYMKIRFHARKHEGHENRHDMTTWHPTLDQAVSLFKQTRNSERTS
jgi:hypothetical protein